VDVQHAEGLEIGAFDFPIILTGDGNCDIADYQSEEDLRKKAITPDTQIAPINYLVERERSIHEQIHKRFDYILLCHVIEHIPNPIGYLQDLENLLKPNGIIFLAIPDKRRTPDKDRQSTTVLTLLDRYYQKAILPSLADVMDFARIWLEDKGKLAENSPQEFFQWATEHYKSGQVDIHCNVWEDKEFFEQFEYLAKSNFLSHLHIVAKLDNAQEYNEFFAVFGLRYDKVISDSTNETKWGLNGSEISIDSFRNIVSKMHKPVILEIGSRQVTSQNFREMLGLPVGSYEYMGFDIHNGPNVDIVGDAHQLSKYFPQRKFDVVMSKSVFEHLAMPWKVVLEINQILKKGGIVFINTVFIFPNHELPWDFWRYTNESWKVLFNEFTGFKIISTELNTPCTIIPDEYPPFANSKDWVGFVNANVIATKIGEYNHDRLKWDLLVNDLLKSDYPTKSGFKNYLQMSG
jgi:2-polyprenyl-3-methyl-5-hydroxy-6-metoxy-1,4-benzoquinol methylase